MFDNVNDAAMRVKHSVIHYKKEPIYINDIFDNDKHVIYASFINLITHVERKRVLLNSKHFDWSAFKLGYVNSDNLGAIYVERQAVRKYKSGLYVGNVRVFDPDGEQFDAIPDDLLYSNALGRTITNVFPSMDAALAEVNKKDGLSCVAFDRHFALYRDELGVIKLLFRNKAIGWLNEDKGLIRLGDAFIHMREELNFKGIKYYANV